ncbi:MAG: sigma-70 family RNA polymerase sigma factor [Chitinophagaceae bacterium]|nr:MAG: sigma-70 family RNA polymerase sigma factor [Chitinophagaceae bacterium]
MPLQDPESDSTNNHTIDPQHWVNRYADYLYSYAAFRIKDPDLARDLVQETFLAALERREKFEGRSSEKTWLTAILKNKVVDIYRSKSSGLCKDSVAASVDAAAEGFFNPYDGHWNDQHSPAEFGIESQDAVENKEFVKILEACMNRLPALWLSVFSMKHIDEETTNQICKELKISASNFWVIIHRTKVNLRSCLQKHWL